MERRNLCYTHVLDREGEHDILNPREGGGGMHGLHICILKEAARGSRRIDLWGTKEKAREQVYQLLGGGGEGARKQNWIIKGDEAEIQGEVSVMISRTAE